MRDREPGQGGERAVPVPARLVRVDRVRGDDLARGVDDRDLDAGAQARIQAHRGAGAGRGGEQQVAQVRGEDGDRGLLRDRPQPHPQVDLQPEQDPGAPGPAHHLGEPLVRRAALVANARRGGDRALVVGDRLLGVRTVPRVEGDVEHVLLLPAEHGEDPVGGQLREGLGEVEVVGELGALGLLARPDRRDQPAAVPHALAQAADQVGVLGEPLDEDGAGALQRRRGVGDVLGHVARGRRGRVEGRVGQQGVGQRLETVLAGDHRLGPPLGLVRQVDVLQAGLRVGREDPRLQRVVELALRADRVEHHGPALLELTQVAQPLLQGAQLGVVEASGGLLAVAGDEGHRGAAVEQVDGGGDLAGTDAELVGDALLDRVGLCGRGVRPRGLLWLDLRTCHSPIVAGGARAVTPGVASRDHGVSRARSRAPGRRLVLAQACPRSRRRQARASR